MTGETLIATKDLYKDYGGAREVVEVIKGVDLTIYAGSTVAITGASGVGKSTLLNIMGALDRPTRGTVYYRGRAISGLDDRDLARLRNSFVGFVFQFHHLLPEFTALENVMLPALIGGAPRGEAIKRAEGLLGEVGLSARLGHKPGELSGGEQQRVAIVRALVQTPEVVLADEPTGNLDTKTATEVFEVLLDLNRNRNTALVVVTHNEALALRMSVRLKMVDGRIEEVK
ncbi:MAG TPA: ABC transporter ATP-binding protein [Thermodesulfobacteriota bacterium]|nr:ABC transporter ATP-binding protein [Thermodesulfobacteriota bacterium]